MTNTYAYLILLRDQDNAIIRPLPKIKRMISDNACLPHIVQVFAKSESDFNCFYKGCCIHSGELLNVSVDGLGVIFFFVHSSCC